MTNTGVLYKGSQKIVARLQSDSQELNSVTLGYPCLNYSSEKKISEEKKKVTTWSYSFKHISASKA